MLIGPCISCHRSVATFKWGGDDLWLGPGKAALRFTQPLRSELLRDRP